MISKAEHLSCSGALARVLGLTVMVASIASAGLALPAFAQQASSADTIEEVVVTARRVEENIQKVPVEVVDVSGKALKEEGIVRVEDLSVTVPGFTAQNSYQSGVPVYTIRGQHGDVNPTPNTEPAVAVYFAGMNQSRAEGTNGAFFDLDSVQVLEGPQGTLFGRNSTGGAILITPKAPESTFGGYGEAGYGNYDDRTFEGVLNVPFSDQVALRLGGSAERRDGYIKDVLTGTEGGGIDENSGRVSLLLKPTESIRSTFIGTYYSSDTSGDTAKLGAIDPHFLFGKFAPKGLGAVANAYTAALAADAVYQTSLGDYTVSDPNNPFTREHVYSAQNNTDLKLNEQLLVKNIVGYREDRQDQAGDFAGSTFDYFFQGVSSHGELFTEELQLQGTFDKFNFVAGAYVLHEHVDDRAFDRVFGSFPGFVSAHISAGLGAALGGALPARDDYVNSYSTQSYSGFFHSTYDLSSLVNGLSLTGGVRVSHDIKKADLHGFNVSGVVLAHNGYVCEEGPQTGVKYATENLAGCLDAQQLSSTLPTWDASVNYQLTPTLLLYTGVSHGYRAGGFDTGQQNPTHQHFDPEFITEYELGEKADFNLGAIPFRLDSSVYYGDYHDIQHLIGVPSAAGGVSNATYNIAGAHLYGGELELIAKPAQALQLTATYAYSREIITSWTYPYQTVFASSAGPAGTLVQLNNADSGYIYVPVNQWSLTAHFDLPVPDRYGAPALSATWYGQTSMVASDDSTSNCGPDGYFTACYSRGGKVPGYNLLNLRAEWKNVGGYGFDLALFCNNAIGTVYKNTVFDLRGTIGESAYVYGPPRMYGLKLTVPFGSEAK